jgi:glutamyl-tRNA synthetase
MIDKTKRPPCGAGRHELAGLLFPNINKTPQDWINRYPQRETAACRIAPSPTGYVHIGTIAQALVNRALAKKSGGVFYLRIEDTDDKRFVGDAVDNMKKTFERFGIKFDEGAFDGGKYAPYIQSERTEIYRSFAKYMVENGAAYPCFCTAEELTSVREKQQKNNEKTGYYGKYAKCRGLPFDEVKKKIAAGEKWVLRADFSKWDSGEGQETARIAWTDCVKGEMVLPAEINDPIILKSNGVPPYNFAHIVDDLLMGTTTVVRGEEYIVSTPQHIQLAAAIGGHRYQYAHLPTISINDNGSKRKLSKRKDKMALALNLLAEGYPAAAITEYLLTLYNTDFEAWRTANPSADIGKFDFKIEKVGTNNPLFDTVKLSDISKNILAGKSCGEITAQFNEFYSLYKPFKLSAAEKARVEKMLCVERGGERARKDLIKFGDIPQLYDYMFDKFAVGRVWTGKEKKVLAEYVKNYSADDGKEQWFAKVKQSAADNNFALDRAEYRQTPEKFSGTLADFTEIIRVALTGRGSTPDLWSICKILGEKMIKNRLQ